MVMIKQDLDVTKAPHELLADIARLERRIASHRERVTFVSSATESITEMKQALGDLRRKIKRERYACEYMFEQYGERSSAIYAKSAIVSPALDRVFAGPQSIRRDAVSAAQGDEEPSRASTALSRFARELVAPFQYRKIGRKVFESSFVEQVGDAELRTLHKNIEKSRRKIKGHENTKRAHEETLNSLLDEAKALPAPGALRKLRRTLQLCQSQHSAAYRKLCALHRDMSSKQLRAMIDAAAAEEPCHDDAL